MTQYRSSLDAGIPEYSNFSIAVCEGGRWRGYLAIQGEVVWRSKFLYQSHEDADTAVREIYDQLWKESMCFTSEKSG